LHAHQEIEAPLGFVEHVRDAVAGLRDVVRVAECVRILDVRSQQVLDVARRPARVLVEIARVVPAAPQVFFGGRVVLVAEKPRVVVLQRADMARPVDPARTDVRGVLVLPHALIEEHAQGLLEHVRVHPFRDLEGVRTHVLLDVDHVVLARLRHAREVEPEGFVARGRIFRARAPHRVRRRVHGDAGRGLHERVGRPRREGLSRVDARLRVADHRDFLGVR
jgi:hypothetical protein